MVHYIKANVTFDWDPTIVPNNRNCITNLQLGGQDLEGLLTIYLQNTLDNIEDPFRYTKYRVLFQPEIRNYCNDVFNAIKILIQTDGDDLAAACLASRLFEYFASYWVNLLSSGKHYVGIGFWHTLLDITTQWESNNTPIAIHKGTPYYFLAETYFIVGDRDNGFVYLYNGLETDRKLSHHAILNYPDSSPSYLTSTMSDNPRNHMYNYIIRELREHLGEYIGLYRRDYNPNFKMVDFETKFLHNQNLTNTVSYFVYNFFYLYDLNKNTNQSTLDNDFSKIRTLDFVFNLSLFIEEILKLAASNVGASPLSWYRVVLWWIQDNKKWMNQLALDTLIGQSRLNLKDGIPDNVVPVLLSNISTPTGGIRKEVYVMLLAYHLRNHGGHNMDQPSILVQKHEEIIKNLFMAIFLAIESL